jgi:Acyl-protein synthetase, LuxE
MSALLDRRPFAERDEPQFVREMADLTRYHLEHSPELRRMWPSWRGAETAEELPFVHVSVFKHLLLRSGGAGRLLRSSGTTGAARSQIAVDEESAALQSRSSIAILADFIGSEQTPLLVVDHSSALRQRGEISARIAAALSLRPLATDISFLLGADDAIKWSEVAEAAARSKHLRVYGFTSALWQAWRGVPSEVAAALRETRIDFVHSGGWKKLEGVTRAELDEQLLRDSGAGSRVVDYYGLVEQNGVVYPLCAAGFRHVPVWAEVIVRDPWTLRPLRGESGMLQLMNVLARGGPYHSVLTEDLGRLVDSACACGRNAPRFELLGRVPKAETRGCANV